MPGRRGWTTISASPPVLKNSARGVDRLVYYNHSSADPVLWPARETDS
jgi:hypothetical protein